MALRRALGRTLRYRVSVTRPVRRHSSVAEREAEALSQLTPEKRAHIQSLFRDRNAYSPERVGACARRIAGPGPGAVGVSLGWAGRPRARRMHSLPAADTGDHGRPSRTEPLQRFLGWDQPLRAGQRVDMSAEQIQAVLDSEDAALVEAVYLHADSVTRRFFGEKIHFRGLIEFSNVCRKNCGYCGIRRDLARVPRYTMLRREIVEQALWAFDRGYGSVMLQSGELPTAQRTRSMVRAIEEIKRRSKERESERSGSPVDQCRGLGVALSLGELPSDHYQALFDAGAHRYLLRIESSSPRLYHQLHPEDHRWESRLACLEDLKRIGFQVGTGVMVGLPSQTTADMAADVRFFRDFGADMVGAWSPPRHPSPPRAADGFARRHGPVRGGGGHAGGRVVAAGASGSGDEGGAAAH